MPLYEFTCSKCNYTFVWRKKLEDYNTGQTCPICKEQAVKIFTSPNIIMR